WSKVSGPGSVSFTTLNGNYYASFSATGTYALRLTASDGDLSASNDVTVIVYDAGTPFPIAGITNPADGVVITAPTNIIGTAGSPILQSWQLRYRPAPPTTLGAEGQGEGGSWTVLTNSTVSLTNSVLARFDPTMLLNGIYQLQVV